MKHYKDKNGKVYAYEADGSNDHRIPKDFTPITNEEAKKISEEITKKLIAEAEKKYANQDPVEKLKSFLASNPDVKEILK